MILGISDKVGNLSAVDWDAKRQYVHRMRLAVLCEIAQYVVLLFRDRFPGRRGQLWIERFRRPRVNAYRGGDGIVQRPGNER